MPPGTRVLFVNNDPRRHDMTSDPHPDRTNCSEINQVGLLNPGTEPPDWQHDHEDPDNNALRGRIVIR